MLGGFVLVRLLGRLRRIGMIVVVRVLPVRLLRIREILRMGIDGARAVAIRIGGVVVPSAGRPVGLHIGI